MSGIVFPYVLTLAVLLFVLGLYRGLAHPNRTGIRTGAILICAGVGVGALGFVSFLPAYFVKPWMGYALVILAMGGMARGIMKYEV